MHSRAAVLLVALSASSAPSVAMAQAPSATVAPSTLADGIQALARGDVVAAVRILVPLAHAADPDPLAQFFAGALYELGSGVDVDPAKACGLFLSPAAHESPLAAQAEALAQTLQRGDSPMRTFCAAAAAGVWREAPTAVFELAPAHSIAVDAAGLTVAYHGTQHTQPGRGSHTWSPLAPRYTRFEVPGHIPAIRHFVESWSWFPNNLQAPTGWSLVWSLAEVVRGDVLEPVTPLPIATVNGAWPSKTLAPEALGRLRLSRAGAVEQVIPGPSPSVRVVPSPGAR
jgi:hypothetical protein